jgi:nucleotide-binding universal stress UspA family protein
VIESDDVEEGINESLANNNYDIVVMLKRDKGLLKSMFHVSLTRKLIHHTKYPLLIIHELR